MVSLCGDSGKTGRREAKQRVTSGEQSQTPSLVQSQETAAPGFLPCHWGLAEGRSGGDKPQNAVPQAPGLLRGDSDLEQAPGPRGRSRGWPKRATGCPKRAPQRPQVLAPRAFHRAVHRSPCTSAFMWETGRDSLCPGRSAELA